ncbi:hypothetical protein C5167_001425 [Papaver somniferum]|uniref:Uncharacterized protein n=1 Tax=Papaver somniferum TaxID=3469 RepID=A0A4Y7KYR7_PAPSO|nr:hypothetical protein C5167_001425 [Papaver somniferum]
MAMAENYIEDDTENIAKYEYNDHWWRLDMAEILVSALSEALIAKLVAFASDRISLDWGVRDEMSTLQRTLRNIQAVLTDAERQQVEKDTVKCWLENLKDVACEAEDILDKFEYKALAHRLEIEVCRQDKIKNFFSVSIPLGFRWKMAHKIKNLREMLDQVSMDKDRFSFDVSNSTSGSSRHRNRETHSLVDASMFVGREKDISRIINLLLDKSSSNQHTYRYVLIVAMGGVGKTTLAKVIYDDDIVKHHFEIRMWVCVSQNSNQKQVVNQLLESIHEERKELSSLDVMIKLLQEKLIKKRYLIVLDDMWNNEHNEWDDMLTTLSLIGAQGSKVIITTRSNEVASATSSLYRYSLDRLSEVECWTMLEKIVFGHDGVEKTTNFVNIGMSIAKKCGGVPLATKFLGSLMYSKRSEREWLSIENNNIWDLPESELKIARVLKLSYDRLEPRLKQCFRYCSLFPKDHIINRENIIRLWMAEGFVSSSRPNVQMEDVGDNYFNSLLSNSFFQEETKNEFGIVKSCKMHDFVHDLAQSVAKTECSIITSSEMVGEEISRYRRVNLVLGNESSRLPKPLRKVKKLRTFISTARNSIDNTSALHIFKSFSYVRVLDLSYSRIYDLPLSIGKLKHLRYLNLSDSKLRELPNSITILYNLQTLILKDCYELKDLPQDMKKLIKLRHLIINVGCGFWNIPPMPEKVSSLSSLTYLPVFVVGDGSLFGIKELGGLNLLGGKLKVLHLKNVRDREEAEGGRLKEKPNILSLKLHWRNGESFSDVYKKRIALIDDSEVKDYGHDFGVLEGLEPNRNLKRFGIYNYLGATFPTWVMSLKNSLPNLVHVVLKNCKKCEYLPPLGILPFLKVLRIEGFESVKSIGNEFYGNSDGRVSSFPCLEDLSIICMDHLVEWSDAVSSTSSTSSFPRLERLKVTYCPKFTCMPTRFPSLKAVYFCRCNGKTISSLVESNLSSLINIYIKLCDGLVFLPQALLRGSGILYFLQVESCESFQGFIPDRNLEDEDVKAIRNQVITNNSLHVLKICHLRSQKCTLSSIGYLPKLETLEIGPFTEEPDFFPFPDVNVDDEGTVIGEYFPSLRKLSITGWSGVSLPDHIQHITSLQTLEICCFDSLVTLPEWLGDYACLREMVISECKNLKYLPSEEQMQRLASLKQLSVFKSPIMKDRCIKEGEEFYKISHLPPVRF